MDDTINITLKIPKAIIETSRDITLTVVLEDYICDQSIVTDIKTAECTFENWKEKLKLHLEFLNFQATCINLIIDSVEFAMKSKCREQNLFSNLNKETGMGNRYYSNTINNQFKRPKVNKMILKVYGQHFTPLEFVYLLTDSIKSQLEDAS